MRALRAHRSQTMLSRRLGFQTNVVYRWESGRRRLRASDFLRAADRCGVDVGAAVARFFKVPVPASAGADDPEEAVRALLVQLQGSLSARQLGERIGRSRDAVQRWLSAGAHPSLADVLRVVHTTTHRVSDFVEGFVDPASVPALAESWEQARSHRLSVARAPYAQAFWCALELAEYQDLEQHEPGWLARRLGMPIETETEALQALEAGGHLRRDRGKLHPGSNVVLDLGPMSRDSHRVRHRWLELAAKRQDDGDPGIFSYNLFGCDAPTFGRIRELHNQYFQQVRALVSDCERADDVVLTQLNLFRLTR